MIKRISISILLLLLSFLSHSALAQTASITGTIKDSSGGLVPQAQITAKNNATNASRSALTDESGTYRITSLVPGMYDLFIEKQGFKTVGYSKLELTVDQVQNLDAKLVPSSITEKVTVKGESVAPVDLNDAQIGNIVTNQQMTSLPLVLRDPYQLALLSPGTIQSNSLLQGLSVNGSRERNNNFLLDGTDNNDAEIPGLSQPQPGLTSLNPDAVQEFRVITSNLLPEFGRNTGAVVDIVTRRGTNDFHSDLYWFGRYDALGARDFFNHQVNSAGQVEPKDSYVRNIFGGSVGGPIKRNKTFWFANYEGQRFVTTLTNTSTVPTPEFKAGQFTITHDAKGNPLPSPIPVDVSTPSSPNNSFGLPLDPLIQKILALYPAPNGSKVDDVRSLLYFPSKTDTTGDNVTARVDHNFTPDETLMVRYTLNRFEDPNFAHTDFLPDLGGTGTLQRRQDASLHLTSVLGQRVVNDFRFGANRINFPLTCQGLDVFNSFGPTDLFSRGQDFPLPGLSGFGCLLQVDRNGSKRFSGTYTVGDDVTLVRGRHTWKVGFEFRKVYSNSTNEFLSRTTVDFNNFSNFGVPAFQTGISAVDSNTTLQNVVWSLFGAVGSQTQAQFFDKGGKHTPDDPRGFRQPEFGAFVQDSYKILPNFTLSYGLRYQFNGVPYEVNNLLSTLFTNPSEPAPFTFVIAGEKDKGLPPLYNNDWHDFEPRIGFAWDPFKRGKTSIRAGYGIFHDRVFGQLLGLTRGNPPFQQIFFAPTFNPTAGGPAVSTLPLPPTLTATAVVNNGAGNFPFLVDPHLRMPYSQNWNFGIQEEPLHNLLIEVDYVGSRGTRLIRVLDGNPPQPALVAQLEALGVPQTVLQFNNLYFGAESGVLPFDAVNNNAFLHAAFFTGAASSIYHALQVNITKRLSHGITMQAAYTWSHTVDNSSDPLVPTAGNQEFPRSSFDLAAERGNSDFDVRQRLVLNYVWEIPIGQGHSHLAGGPAGKILEGWQVAGITTFSSGLPFDIFTDLDTAHVGEVQRPDFNPTAVALPVSNPRTQTGPNLAFFPDPPFGRGGNLGRNRFRGPGINNWDMLLQKTIHISERLGLELRTEAYDLFNRVQFSQPGNLTSNSGTFGQSTLEVRRADGTSGARQIQFGIKLKF